MKYTILLFIVLFLGKISFAQKVTFDYNNNGARIVRYVDLPKPELRTSVIDISEPTIKDDLIKSYPNPVKDFLQIEISDNNTCKAVVYDVFGRIVFTINNLSASNSVDFSHLPTGVYLLNIADKTYKILKE